MTSMRRSATPPPVRIVALVICAIAFVAFSTSSGDHIDHYSRAWAYTTTTSTMSTSVVPRRAMIASSTSKAAMAISSFAALAPFGPASSTIAHASSEASLSSVVLAAAAAIDPASRFCGEYSDPINHPGGTRTISLVVGDDGAPQPIGDYRLAKVTGGGGRGEPKEYVLPALILGDRAIIIDFSPKGGPRDFAGVLDPGDGSIRFPRDGNRWPRIG